MRSRQDLRVSLAELSLGKAPTFMIEANRPSRVSEGQLICGHCGEPLPILDEGATLPKEKDCATVPVQFRIDGDSLVVRAADIEAGRPLFARIRN